MQEFIQRHGEDVIGILSGFDRLLFRGTLRSIAYGDGLDKFLGAVGVPYKDFKVFAEQLTQRLKDHAKAVAKAAGRPHLYLQSSRQSKEELARAVAERDGITEGLICVLSCVEPCKSFSIRRDGGGRFRFMRQERKCLHLYFYYLDREFGLMHVRLMTWLPFDVQVCLNGREVLARQMERAGMGFEQRDNCFTWIEDLPRAQAMLTRLETRRWERVLKTLARRVNPLIGGAKGLPLFPYYWTARSTEVATDVMFKDASTLRRLYPALAEHAIRQFDSADVLRFLGRRTNRRFSGEVTGSYLRREEGLRVKHWVEENSIKMYDKEGSVLRIETTIDNPRRFKVRRMTTRQGEQRMRWIPMRKGVVDLQRRAKVSRAANERYLEALAMVGVPCPAAEVLDEVSRRRVKQRRPYRGLRPVSREDAHLFKAALRGEFLVRGFTNRQLREAMGWKHPHDPQQRRRESARMTRRLRLLRAHGLIRKVSHTHYYRVTPKGHRIMTAALRLREADIINLAA